jgi:hypothetical protein
MHILQMDHLCVSCKWTITRVMQMDHLVAACKWTILFSGISFRFCPEVPAL